MKNKRDADLIIVGSGGTGLMAAIYAADEGAKVLLIEKGSELGGTFIISQGTSVGTQTKMQFEAGILDDTPDLFYADCMKEERARKVCDPEILKFYCEQAGTMIDWMYDRGAYAKASKCEKPIYGEVWSKGRMYRVDWAKSYLDVILKEYQRRVDRGDVKHMLNTKVNDLISEKGRVVGVAITDKAGVKKEYFSGVVIIATGGFCGNLDMMRKYKHPGARAIINVGWADATGDGLAWLTKLGTKFVNMDQELLPYMGTVPDPKDITRPLAHMNMNKIGGGIWVDLDGKRVSNEDVNQYWPPPRIAMSKVKENVLFALIDNKIRTGAESIFIDWLGACSKKTWEWFDEQANQGKVIFKADTLEQLAVKAGISPNGIRETANRWNSFVASGKDEEFGRKSVSVKLDAPPFYAILTVPANLLSAGGPATNVRMQVLHESGKVIPGLYAAGEVTGYRAFGTGGMNTGCFVFGKQAGLHAAWEALGLSES
jgi:fumarate reductase flavoprotein subunit